jgi:hypothetical protein
VTSTCWLLDERVASSKSSEYRYSAGNAMGIVVVVVVDREEVECCATARSDIRNPPRTTYMSNILELNC